jgi:periplasmic protein TonB
MPDARLKRRLRFTIYHGFVASIAIHWAVALPFVVQSFAQPPDEPEMLALELQGVVADNQVVQKVLQETKGDVAQEEKQAPDPQKPEQKPTPPAASKDEPREVASDDSEAPPPPAPAPAMPTPKAETSPAPAKQKTGSAGANNVTGTQEQQNAQTIKTDPDAAQRLAAYSRLVAKKVYAKLVAKYRDRKSVTVSFRILSDGHISPDTLKIAGSSGDPRLDAGALQTVRASMPFPPPPEEVTVQFVLDFGLKH